MIKTKPYDGWLVSNNFWKRAIAVWLHGLVIQLIIGMIFFFVVLGFVFAVI